MNQVPTTLPAIYTTIDTYIDPAVDIKARKITSDLKHSVKQSVFTPQPPPIHSKFQHDLELQDHGSYFRDDCVDSRWNDETPWKPKETRKLFQSDTSPRKKKHEIDIQEVLQIFLLLLI